MNPAAMTWIQAGAGAASSSTAIGMQRLGAGFDRRQQAKSQEQMMGIQMRGEKEMMDYQQQKEMEIWEKTGYKAQVEQMMKAGINPALMYGMGGGGGQTIGHGGSPAVTGGVAPYIDTMGIGASGIAGMMKQAAEIELLKAQTKKANAEADKTTGPDTANTEALTGNVKADTAIKEVELHLRQIEDEIKGATQNAAKAMVMQELRTSWEKMEMIKNEHKISDETINAKISQITQDAIGAYARNELTRAQTKLTDEQRQQLSKTIALEYDKLRNETDKTAIQKQLANFQTSFGGQAATILRTLLGK